MTQKIEYAKQLKAVPLMPLSVTNERLLDRLNDATVDRVTLRFNKTFLAESGGMTFGTFVHNIIVEADKKGFRLCRPAIFEIDGQYAITFARKDKI
jgi:hypothetical protein